MNKITLILVFVFAVVKLQAQDYQIGFAGAGATTTVETVQVQNLTQGNSLDLNGSDVLHLMGTVGIAQLVTNDDKSLRIYPNPMMTHGNIEFEVSKESVVTVELYDVAGKITASVQSNLSAGMHTYSVSKLSKGFYTVSIKSDNFIYSGKIVSNNYTNEKAIIKHVNSTLIFDESNYKSSNEIIPMQYNNGDLLLFRGISGDYATVSTLTPTSNSTVTFDFVSATDDDGNNYGTVTIGSQTWMTENLKLETASSSVYPGVGEEYGRLYYWDEALTVCPAGWHLPSDEEWTTLTTFLGGESIAGRKLKESGTTHWLNSNTGTNETGFTALPGGGFFTFFGTYAYLGEFGYWWSSTQVTEPGFENNAMIRNMKNISNYCNRTPNFKGDKLSIRCIKD